VRSAAAAESVKILAQMHADEMASGCAPPQMRGGGFAAQALYRTTQRPTQRAIHCTRRGATRRFALDSALVHSIYAVHHSSAQALRTHWGEGLFNRVPPSSAELPAA
jgi:hypothetical protein